MSAAVFSILGGQGFIGKALIRWLRDQGHVVNAPARDLSVADLKSVLRGHVVYCIGITGDFRSRPWDTVDAHIGVLRHLLADGDFESLTYLSSTRVYLGNVSGSEDAVLSVSPENTDQLYNLSKLMGEALCHVAHRPERPVRAVRLSNVIGGDARTGSFVHGLLEEALTTGVVRLRDSLDAAKDYIALEDVVTMLERIALAGRASCYNLASGQQISNRALLAMLAEYTGARVLFEHKKPGAVYPPIDTERLRNEFGFAPLPIRDYLETWLECRARRFRKELRK